MKVDDLYRGIQGSPQAGALQRLARPAGTTFGRQSPAGLNSLSPRRLPPDPTTAEEAKLKEAAQEFEQFFLQLLLKQARQTTQAMRGEETSQERQTYEEWQDEGVARAIASGQGIGLGEQLYKQLIETQLRAGTSAPQGNAPGRAPAPDDQ